MEDPSARGASGSRSGLGEVAESICCYPGERQTDGPAAGSSCSGDVGTVSSAACSEVLLCVATGCVGAKEAAAVPACSGRIAENPESRGVFNGGLAAMLRAWSEACCAVQGRMGPPRPIATLWAHNSSSVRGMVRSVLGGAPSAVGIRPTCPTAGVSECESLVGPW